MSIARRAAKRDTNEPKIVERLEAYDYFVGRLSLTGWPDLTALRFGVTTWCEVKQPGESFTPEQTETFRAMAAKGVPVYVLETVEDVDALTAGKLAPWTGEGITVRDAKKVHQGKRKHRPGHSKARNLDEVCLLPNCITSRLAGGVFCAKHEEGTS